MKYCVILMMSLLCSVMAMGQSKGQQFLKAARAGNVEAQYQTGLRYALGMDLPESVDKSLYWFKKAAEKGHTGAMWAYAYQLDILRDTKQKKKPQSEEVYWMDKSADGGYYEAQNHAWQNYMYFATDDGYPVNDRIVYIKKAIKYLEMAYNNDSPKNIFTEEDYQEIKDDLNKTLEKLEDMKEEE